MRDPIEALDPLDQFKSSVEHLAAIMAFELVELLSPWVGNASLHRDDDMVSYTIEIGISMSTTYCSCSLVILLDINGTKTTMAIIHGQSAGRRRKRIP